MKRLAESLAKPRTSDPENVGGIALGDSATSPTVVLCPITREDCVQGCIHECASGTLRTPVPLPAEVLPYGQVDYALLTDATILLGKLSDSLASWDGTYRHGLCSERCERAAQAVRHALSGLDIFLGDEGAAAVLAPRKETR